MRVLESTITLAEGQSAKAGVHTCVHVSSLCNIRIGMCWVVVMLAACPRDVCAIECYGRLFDSMLRVAVTHPAVCLLLRMQRSAHIRQQR